jgi:hypothetical protein
MPNCSIEQLPDIILTLPEDMQTLCKNLLSIEKVDGYTVPPPDMLAWIERHFVQREYVERQTIIKVTNLHTLEAASFNGLRARRPLDDAKTSQSHQDEALEKIIADSSGSQDTFHDPLKGTPADVFGRIHGRYAVSASNIAKYDGWHGLVIFNEFHPLCFNREQLHDYFDVAIRWLIEAHTHDPQARYPLITWNCLWKSGASIIHGHMQMILSRAMATGQVERWRRAATSYHTQHQRNLRTDLWLIHKALGLGFHETDDTYGYATLTPVKDTEIILATKHLPLLKSSMPSNAQAISESLVSLWNATYTALRALIDQHGIRSFNLVVYLPPFGTTDECWEEMHGVEVRLVDRGNPLSRMVNFGAMELFASSIITTDPFHVASSLRT